MTGDDASASILTERQRDLLRGESDLSKRGERAARARIRERLQAAFEDLRLILNTDLDGCRGDVKQALAETDAVGMWPLPALLFLWAGEHPMFTDRDDLADTLSTPDETGSISAQMDRITTAFDSQIESGVSAALGLGEHNHVPEEVTNELTVTLGEPVADRTDKELADLPRRTLDLLFRRGDLDNQEYARVMGMKLDREDDSEE